MKRLWLEIHGIRLNNVRYSDDLKKQIYLDVRLKEAFKVRGVMVGRMENSEDGLALNWAMSDIRFIDASHFHKQTRKKKLLLSDELAVAIMEESRHDIMPFLSAASDPSSADLEYPRLTVWSKKSLRIPIDFIRFENFRCPNVGNDVFADFVIGRHIIIPQIQIFNGSKIVFDPDHRVINKELRALAEFLIKRRTLQHLARSVSKSRIDEIESGFTLVLKHCDLKGIPPAIRFY